MFIGESACPLCLGGEHVVPHTEWFAAREAALPGAQAAAAQSGGASEGAAKRR